MTGSHQECPNMTDPRTGAPLNFNFLPMKADTSVGVYPHTVQIASINGDPTWGSYGQQNFTFMLDWLIDVSGKGRSVVFKPETAYWTNYDIDVPLLLPVYPLKRVEDLHAIAAREAAAGTRIQGQVIFSSGWEWNYWLSDVVAAEAAWDPRLAASNASEALGAIVDDVLRNVVPDAATRSDLSAWFVGAADMQNATLIYGERGGGGGEEESGSASLTSNGMAYVEGWDAIADVERLSAELVGPSVPQTQPPRRGFEQVALRGPAAYARELRPLLAHMATASASLLSGLNAIAAQIHDASGLVAELVDAWNVTALRARFELLAYDHAANRTERAALAAARGVLTRAAALVARRERHYRAPLSTIAGWGPNPTSYHFGYLWPVHALYYWWRDYYQAQGAASGARDVWSPCFLNIQDPVDSQFGNASPLNNISADVYRWLERHHLGGLGDCLMHPPEEPTFPLHV